MDGLYTIMLLEGIFEAYVRMFLVFALLMAGAYAILIFLPLLFGRFCQQRSLGRWGSFTVLLIICAYLLFKGIAGENIVKSLIQFWFVDQSVAMLSVSTSLGFVFYILLKHWRTP